MILQINNLSFKYKSRPVIEGVSFSVREGEILSILGRNGAGKTTLLKCINRILTLGQGSVTVKEQETAQMSGLELARIFGWVPQHAEMTMMKVFDLILLGRKPHFKWAPTTADYMKVEEVIALTGIEDIALRYADELSGGEFQQVQIARALAQDPTVILFDEPTSSLDIYNQHRLMRMIVSVISSSHRSAIMAMHDLNLSLRYSDSFLLLKDGEIWAAGGKEVITAENIRAVYGMEVRVEDIDGHLIVIPL